MLPTKDQMGMETNLSVLGPFCNDDTLYDGEGYMNLEGAVSGKDFWGTEYRWNPEPNEDEQSALLRCIYLLSSAFTGSFSLFQTGQHPTFLLNLTKDFRIRRSPAGKG